MELARVMVFYDGEYFKRGQIYFRYKEKRGWFSLSALHGLMEKFVASNTKTPIETTKVVGAHYCDGRPTTKATDPDQLLKDRGFEMALIHAGIVPHYLELSETLRPESTENDPQYRLMQKGVDVHLALDVLDYAHDNRLDIAVLVTGDGDFVPLVRKVTSLGGQVLLAHFTIDQWVDDNGFHHKPTYASRALIDCASWTLDFNQLVRDPNWKAEVKSLFFVPKSERAS